MSYSLTFDSIYSYDSGKPGISIPITLMLGNNQLTINAKLDTGASHCIFSRASGEYFGLDVESGHRLTFDTPMGSFYAFGHSLNLAILDFDFEATVFFAADYSFSRNVLGRNGFLNKFQIAIVDYDGNLFLSTYKQ